MKWEEFAEIKPMHRKSIKKYCHCTPRCEKVIEFDSIDKIICENRAIEMARNMLSLVNGQELSTQKGRGWTMRQTSFLKKWVEEKGVKNGDYRLIGDMIGKTRHQVKNKVQYMEKIGELRRTNQ